MGNFVINEIYNKFSNLYKDTFHGLPMKDFNVSDYGIKFHNSVNRNALDSTEKCIKIAQKEKLFNVDWNAFDICLWPMTRVNKNVASLGGYASVGQPVISAPWGSNKLELCINTDNTRFNANETLMAAAFMHEMVHISQYYNKRLTYAKSGGWKLLWDGDYIETTPNKYQLMIQMLNPAIYEIMYKPWEREAYFAMFPLASLVVGSEKAIEACKLLKYDELEKYPDESVRIPFHN